LLDWAAVRAGCFDSAHESLEWVPGVQGRSPTSE
jgi:hypothetical protein